MFLQRLPADIRGHLITKKCENARDLAILADKLCVARQQDFTTASISAATSHDIDDHMDDLAVVRNLPHKRQPPRSPQPTSSDPSLYCFHRKWGDFREKEPTSRQTTLLYLRDSLSNRRFLGDTGASLSVFPHVSSLPCSNLHLISADGRAIRSWGTKTINLQFGKRRVSWDFRLAQGFSTFFPNSPLART